MNTKLIVIFLFIGNSSFAQFKPLPTQFDKFVNKPKIEWAAYASDTFNFAGFNNLLLNRLHKKQIKASLPVDSRTPLANKIEYALIDSIDKVFFYEEDDYAMDSLGNVIRVTKPRKKIDSAEFKITEVMQILYIEDGKLKSYVPWVTPTVPTYISTGTYVGERFYFNTAYNYKYDYKPRKRHTPDFLGQTKKMLKFDAPADKLKEMYGRNLLETLWPQLLQNGTEFYAVDSNKKINPQEIDITTGYKQPLLVPHYDSAGTIYKYSVIYQTITPAQFTAVQLVQDWYYDHKKNIVFSYIRDMYVYLKEDDKNASPVFKLVFK